MKYNNINNLFNIISLNLIVTFFIFYLLGKGFIIQVLILVYMINFVFYIILTLYSSRIVSFVIFVFEVCSIKFNYNLIAYYMPLIYICFSLYVSLNMSLQIGLVSISLSYMIKEIISFNFAVLQNLYVYCSFVSLYIFFIQIPIHKILYDIKKELLRYDLVVKGQFIVKQDPVIQGSLIIFGFCFILCGIYGTYFLQQHTVESINLFYDGKIAEAIANGVGLLERKHLDNQRHYWLLGRKLVKTATVLSYGIGGGLFFYRYFPSIGGSGSDNSELVSPLEVKSPIILDSQNYVSVNSGIEMPETKGLSESDVNSLLSTFNNVKINNYLPDLERESMSYYYDRIPIPKLSVKELEILNKLDTVPNITGASSISESTSKLVMEGLNLDPVSTVSGPVLGPLGTLLNLCKVNDLFIKDIGNRTALTEEDADYILNTFEVIFENTHPTKAQFIAHLKEFGILV